MAAKHPMKKAHAAFFAELGPRFRALRHERGWNQEDMMSYGFALRHWQRIENGKSITHLAHPPKRP